MRMTMLIIFEFFTFPLTGEFNKPYLCVDYLDYIIEIVTE